MPRLASVSAHNLKVPAFRHDLGPVTVITGDNAVGKSARLEAIRLGLLGFVPGLPRTNAGVFSLSCGSDMGVSLRLTDGKEITRHYSQKGDSIKCVEMAKGLEVPPVLLDATEYLRLSERERVKYVFGLVQLDEARWSGEAILKLIGETPIDCDKEIVEAVVLAKRAIFKGLSESDLVRYDNGESVQGWLDQTLEDLRQKVRNTNAALGRFEKYSQAAVVLKAGDNGIDQANCDRLLKEKRQALQEASNALAVARQKTEQAGRNASVRKELERRLSEPFDAKAIESTRKQIADLEAAQVERVDLGDLAFKTAEARSHLETGKQILKQILTDIETLDSQHERDLKSPKCPHCGTGGQKFKTAIKKLYSEKRVELIATKHKTEQAIAIDQEDYTKAGKIYETAAIADKKAERDRLLLQSLKAELTRLETLACNRLMWRKQLDGLGPADAVEAVVVETLTKDVRGFEVEVSELVEKQKRWIAAAHEARRQAEARAERQKLEAELMALKAIVKSVEIIQSQMVAEAFGRILADVNRFTRDILLSPIDYHDGELGRWSGTVWVPHRSFSGTEQLISCSGISVALARQSPVRIVLLDELGRLSVENKQALARRLVDLTVEGFIDQAVCVDLDDEPYRKIEGVQVIEL